jgi:hypothetical protein
MKPFIFLRIAERSGELGIAEWLTPVKEAVVVIPRGT